MSNKEAIFIFTKDRPNTLAETLRSVQYATYTKYVIDDSVSIHNQKVISELCRFYPYSKYLGKFEFNHFISQRQIEFPEFAFLLNEFGSINWNLGFARNFALLYAKYHAIEKVLFMDDDIIVPSISIIDELFTLLSDYKFVGAHICQMTDNSILEHIAKDLDLGIDTMLSGGFMAFNPKEINHFFLNIYNEDWIWFYMQLKNEKYLQTGNVFQTIFDPFNNFKKRILFQEFGEIAIDGILDLFSMSSFESLTKVSFWEKILKEREEYLDELAKIALNKKMKKYIAIIKHIKDNSYNFNPNIFKKLFVKYSSDRILFNSLYDTLQ